MTSIQNMSPQQPPVPENELVVLDPSHPLMSRFQNALKKHLSKQKEQLDQELREVSDNFKRHKLEREDVGVLLYGIQQELAKQQTEMETVSNKVNLEKSERLTAEKDLQAQKQVFIEANEELFTQIKKNQELQTQIEQMNQKIVYMEEAKNNVHADVRTLHRATAKAGVELAAAELDKRRQDIFVDRLTNRVENLQDDKTKYEAQMFVQEKETGAYREMLAAARTEIEAIELDKKRLMQQWDSSIITMKKRDEYYTTKNKELDDLIENSQSVEMEIIGLKKTILDVQRENEKMTAQFARIEGDASLSKRKLEDCQNYKNQLLTQYTEWMQVYKKTEQEMKNKADEKNNSEKDLTNLNKEIEKQHQNIKNLESNIDSILQDKQTAKHASQAMKREITTVRQRRRELEAELAKSDNKIIRDALKCSNVVGKCRALESKIGQQNAEIRQVNEQIDLVEHDINKKRSMIERNQTTIDTKNKEMEGLLANAGGEDLGPLEIQANSIKKSVEEISLEIVQHEQQWLKKQYELVKVSKDKSKRDEDLDCIKKQFTIYLERKLRIEREIEVMERERTQTLRSIRNMQNDMLKLNTLMNKERKTENDLDQGNILAENEFVHELKEAELSMIELEKKRDNLYMENQKLTRNLLEADRQVMLWEGKTQLAKETRDAVDKEVGQGEIKQMKSEIHRMEVRFSQLMKDQEKFQRESEQIIEQRTSISIRAEARSKNEKQKGHLTKTAFERQMNEKRRTIKKLNESSTDIDMALQDFEKEQNKTTGELEEKQMYTQTIYNNVERVQNDLYRQQEEKNWNVIQLSVKQNLLKEMKAVSENKAKLTVSSIEQTKKLIKLEQDKAANLQNICDRLSQDFPGVAHSFRAVSRTLMGSFDNGENDGYDNVPPVTAEDNVDRNAEMN